MDKQDKTKKIHKKLDTAVANILKTLENYEDIEILADALREVSYIVKDGAHKKKWDSK